jgi:transcriptional regulator with XRE-family HTH domain
VARISVGKTVGDLGGHLREQRRQAQLSLRQLADLTGVSNPYLSQIERGLRRPSAEVLQQIAKALRISAESLYVQAGLLDPDDSLGGGGVEAAIAADPRLEESQRRALLEIYRSFVGHTDAPTTAGPTTPDTDDLHDTPSGTRDKETSS